MDLHGVLGSKIGGIPAPIVILGGGALIGLYLKSRNAANTSATGLPTIPSSSSNLPTAVDPNTGAVYAIDPTTGQAFELPWNIGNGSAPLGSNNGINPPIQNPTIPTPATPAPNPLDSSIQTAPLSNIKDLQGQILSSNPIGTVNTQITGPPVVVSNTGDIVPIGTTPNQDLNADLNAGYIPPQANNTTQVPDVITGQPNYTGSLYLVGDHPVIYG
jgi:hypothetical protein